MNTTTPPNSRRAFLRTVGAAAIASACPRSHGEDPPEASAIAPKPATRIIVDRGSTDVAVENSLTSFEFAFQYRGDGIKVDIRQTSDGIPVVFHDPWIDRTVGHYGNLKEYSLEELQLYPFREPQKRTPATERIPTLSQAIDLCKKPDGLVYLDILEAGMDHAVRQIVADAEYAGRIIAVGPRHSEALLEGHWIQPALPQGSAVNGANDYAPGPMREILERPQKGIVLVNDSRCVGTLLGRNFSPSQYQEPPALAFDSEPGPTELTRIINGVIENESYPLKRAVARIIATHKTYGWKYCFQQILQTSEDRMYAWMWGLGRMAEFNQITDDIKQFILYYMKSEQREDRLEILAEVCGSADVRDSVALLVSILIDHPPVAALSLDLEQQQKDRQRIRLRAAAAKALGRICTNRHVDEIALLREVAKRRSLHTDGAYIGLDAAQAIQALARMEEKENEAIYEQAIFHIDPTLEKAASDPAMPLAIQQAGPRWDFRIRHESIMALGHVITKRSRDILQSILDASPETLDPLGDGLQGAAARALCAGAIQLTADDARQLCSHGNPSVQRAAFAMIANQRDPLYDDVRNEFIPWYFDMR